MQGRFLRPVDNFFMGMELSDSEMELCLPEHVWAMLSFVKTFEPDVHTSFGVSKGSQTELPHLVTPQFKGVDAIVETVDGTGKPPPLGSDLLCTQGVKSGDLRSAARRNVHDGRVLDVYRLVRVEDQEYTHGGQSRHELLLPRRRPTHRHLRRARCSRRAWQQGARPSRGREAVHPQGADGPAAPAQHYLRK